MNKRELVVEEIRAQLAALSTTYDSQTLAAMLTMYGASLWKGLRLVGKETLGNLEEIVKLFREQIFEAGTPPSIIVLDGGVAGRIQ